MKLAMVNVQLIAALVCLFAALCSSCFIRNCPLGGKRSSLQVSTIHAQRECMRCGPAGLGQCIGPNICCGQAIGCFINSAETKACEQENDIPTPCRVEGGECGQGQGHCVADGVCCTDEGCRLESTCDAKRQMNVVENSTEDFSSDLTPDLIQYIKRLLAARATSAYRRK